VPESPYKRYRDNWDQAFSSSDQANSPIDTTASGNNEFANKPEPITNPPAPKPKLKQRGEPTSVPKGKNEVPGPWANFWVQVALCVFTLGAFIAAGVYAHIAAEQKEVMALQLLAIGGQNQSMQQQLLTMDKTLREIQKQTPSVKRSADAAKGAAITARLAMEVGQRAWLAANFIPEKLFVGKPIVSSLELSNTGKTPVIGGHGWVAFTVVESTATIVFDPDVDVVKINLIPIFPNQKPKIPLTLLYKQPTMAHPAPRILSQPGLIKLQEGTSSLFMYGRIDYDDVFKKSHWVKFCVTGSSPRAEEGMNPITVSPNANKKECNKYNDIDK
jgi:hypothetical protein